MKGENMTQKLFLTSALAMGFVAPVFAEPSNTGTFPNDGYMQEDYTYTNAATADNMDSVYEGSVNAIAEYTEIPYSAEEGFYLTGVDDNNDAITAECTSGNFCPGVASTTYENNAFGNTGLQSCSTATSGAYTLSDAGASSSGQCYRTCNGNVSILHATGVTGNDYSDGTNTCVPTDCENGWHVKEGVNLSPIQKAIGDSEGENYAMIKPNREFYQFKNGNGTDHDQSFYGITDINTWAVYFGSNGMLQGEARCSETGRADTLGDVYTSEQVGEGSTAGKYCYCRLTGYVSAEGVAQSLISNNWVRGDGDVSSYCYSNNCVSHCAKFLVHSEIAERIRNFRAALFNNVETIPASCEANVININWYNADAEDISANNAGTATYGSDVHTPVKAQTIKGKTFRGWRFSAPEQTNLPN